MRVYNFAAGPSMLPLEVLEEAQRDLLDLNGTGMSVTEMSHRSKTFMAIVKEAEEDLRKLLAIPEDYFEKAFASAVETAEKNNTALYCGEYGVIDRANPEDTVKWFRLIHAAFEKYQISRAAWSYKEMDFGLSDSRMDAVRDELIPLL